jgi:predicted RNA binding protein YcfA (HicA-like mRNA interferase family)
VQQAAILTGSGASARPTLQTVGNFTADANDVFRLSDLFHAQTGTSGTATAGYRVALGDGGGQLLLNGTDVTSRTSFTVDEFARLTYAAGADGTQQTLVVVAQSGKRLPTGTLSQVVDSPAVQITANVATGSRSINAMKALITTPSEADASVVGIVQQAGILTGSGASARPTLQTVGNFTADANDVFRLSDLFHAQTGTSGTATAGYRVALGDGGGQLLLNGTDVTSRTSFTADEFARLTYTAGADGTQQTLVVVAQSGKRLPTGTLSGVVDSPAVQITANVATGSRSINAMSALITTPSGADANVVRILQEAGILTGSAASARPTLQTVGNFTADANDVFRLSDLFHAQSGTSGTATAGYRVALGDGGGQLQLDGTDVTSRTSFTVDEFARLTYTAGAAGTQQALVVVAQSGKRLPTGTLSGVVDSSAVQIIANVATGSRSINAMKALITTPSGADANVVGIVQQAGILTGSGASARPTLQTQIRPQPSVSRSALSTGIGAYNTAGSTTAGSPTDLSSFDPTATGTSMSPGTFLNIGGSLAVALLLLDHTATGAFQTANRLITQSQAIKAYNTT